MLLPITSSDLAAAFKPLRPCWKDMVMLQYKVRE
jgi:hypothetical protein